LIQGRIPFLSNNKNDGDELNKNDADEAEDIGNAFVLFSSCTVPAVVVLVVVILLLQQYCL
jgi:hypothetical protein